MVRWSYVRSRKRYTRLAYRPLNVLALGLAAGMTVAAYMLFFGIISTYFGVGANLIDIYSSIYIGFAASVLGITLGTLWGFVYGFILGTLLGALYNRYRHVYGY